MEIRIGIIGCGNRIRSLLKLILQQCDRVRVTAICDPDAEAVARTSAMLPETPTVYNDFHQLVQDDQVDWVFVGSWNCFHKEQIVAAFEAGKDVFCEKPLAISLQECIAVKQAWMKAQRTCMIGFTLRFSPHYRRIKQVLDDGFIGEIISFEFNETLNFNHGGYIHSDWRRLQRYAGTHLLEKCCHDLDIANWLTGTLAARVAGFGGLDFFLPKNAAHIDRLDKNEKGQAAYCTWPSATKLNPFTCDKDIYDNQVAILEYFNGMRATFHTNCNAGIPQRRMYICGTEGGLNADLISGTLDVRRIGFTEKTIDYSADVSGHHGGGDEILAGEFLDCALHGALPKATLEDGYTAAITAFAIDRATETGHVIDLTDYWRQAGVKLPAPRTAAASSNIVPPKSTRMSAAKAPLKT